MGRVGKGVPIADSIVRHDTCYRVRARVGRRDRERRFPLGTPLATMQAWQLRARAALLSETPTVATGTLAADVPRFLATVASPKTRAYHSVNLAPWVERFGHVARGAITSVMLRQALAHWQTEPRRLPTGELGPPYAANTLNQRLSSLRRLYTVLDADDDEAVNPCARVPKLATPDPEPREIPARALEAIFAALPTHRYQGLDPETTAAVYAAATVPGANRSAIARAYGISETAVRKIVQRQGATERRTLAASRIRLEVKRHTGLPWKQIGAIRDEHLRVAGDAGARAAGHLWVVPRRKGKGTQGRWLPLTRAAVEAIQTLLREAPGPFSASAIYQVFKRGIARAQAAAAKANEPLPALPANVRPYDLRHTFLTQVQRAGRDRKATQGLGLHSNPSTTDRYIRGAEVEGEEAALAALSRARQNEVAGRGVE